MEEIIFLSVDEDKTEATIKGLLEGLESLRTLAGDIGVTLSKAFISLQKSLKDRGRFCVLAVKGIQLHIVINKKIMKIGKQFCALVGDQGRKLLFYFAGD